MPDNELTFEEMVEFLSEEIFGHLGLSDGEDVYVVPINHTYSDGEILMHCALEGRKLDMIRASSAACFEVSRMIGVPVPHGPESCDEPFKSVICRGTARVVDDIDGDLKLAAGCRHLMVRLLAVGGRYGQIGLVQVAVPVAAVEVLDTALIAEFSEIGAQFGRDYLHMGPGPLQKRHLAGGDLAAADHDAELIPHGKEYR